MVPREFSKWAALCFHQTGDSYIQIGEEAAVFIYDVLLGN